MHGQLNTYEEDAFKLWVLSAERKTLEGLNRPLIERDKAFDTLKEKKFCSFVKGPNNYFLTKLAMFIMPRLKYDYILLCYVRRNA